MSAIADIKAELRAACLDKRRGLPAEQRMEAALSAGEHAKKISIPRAQIIAAYLPIRDEFDSRPIIQHFQDLGHIIVLPVIKGSSLIFRKLDRSAQLKPGPFGTREPSAEGSEYDPDVIFLPLAGFDMSGNRLGYGKGYYDHAITDLKARRREPLRLIGIGFDIQNTANIPAQAHDQRLDAILTESGIIKFG